MKYQNNAMKRNPVIITVNGRGDTAILGLQDYYQMKSELELLRIGRSGRRCCEWTGGTDTEYV